MSMMRNGELRVFITGATGLVGRALALRLLSQGHQVTAWVRDVRLASDQLGDAIELVGAHDSEGLRRALTSADAVINLAGAPVVGRRWSQKYRQVLRDSRVGVTQNLVRAMSTVSPRPKVLVSASAVGYYGTNITEPVSEKGPAGSGFLAQLCSDWEEAALRAVDLGARVALARIGLVFDPYGGALAKLGPLARWRLGGRIGSGQQWTPWIHIDDLVDVLVHALVDPSYVGPFNAVASSVRNQEIAAGMARCFGRRALPVPRLALHALLGQSASVLTGGQNVVPRRLQVLGYRPRFGELQAALDDCLMPQRTVKVRSAAGGQAPVAGGIEPTHILTQRTRIAAPLDEVFGFFSQPGNLALLTPPNLHFSIQTSRPITMEPGAIIDYRIRLGWVPMSWRTVIEAWEPQTLFVDRQDRGPYRLWWHEHRFKAVADGTTEMEDCVYYRLPFGGVGRWVHWLWVGRNLRHIFEYRKRAVGQRFHPNDHDVVRVQASRSRLSGGGA